MNENEKVWANDAKKVRDNPVWVCFEHTDMPLVWSKYDPDDSTFPGVAGMHGYPETTCKEHAELLGCGWYVLVPENVRS